MCVLDKAAGETCVAIHLLGKADEIFVVGVDVGDLDVNQQQHL